jgi:hypothetical protein
MGDSHPHCYDIVAPTGVRRSSAPASAEGDLLSLDANSPPKPLRPGPMGTPAQQHATPFHHILPVITDAPAAAATTTAGRGIALFDYRKQLSDEIDLCMNDTVRGLTEWESLLDIHCVGIDCMSIDCTPIDCLDVQVELLRDNGDGWLYGRCRGAVGLLPGNYVRVVVPIPAAAAPAMPVDPFAASAAFVPPPMPPPVPAPPPLVSPDVFATQPTGAPSATASGPPGPIVAQVSPPLLGAIVVVVPCRCCTVACTPRRATID